MIRYELTKDTWLIRESVVALDSQAFEVLDADAPNAVLAYDGEKLVGMFGYKQRGTTIHAKGTRVRVAYRGQGVGAAMWCVAIQKHRARCVSVLVVSSKAVRMLRNVEAQIPGVRIRAYFGTGPNGGTMRSGEAWERDHPARRKSRAA